jgi:hypothetical protein
VKYRYKFFYMRNQLFLGFILVLIFISTDGICQQTSESEKNNSSKNAIYGENMMFLMLGVKYDRNILKKNNFKLNAGIGLGSTVPLFIPDNISCPLELNMLFGKVHHLEIGVMIAPTRWFSKNYSDGTFFGVREVYTENISTIPAYFRCGYRYQKETGVFVKVNVGQPIMNLNKNYPNFFSYNYIIKSNQKSDLPSGLKTPILFWPSVGIGYSF